jgi:hypothetical protein
VRPLTSVYANRSARFQITVRTSHPDLMPGAFAQVRRLGPAEVTHAETTNEPSVLTRVEIRRANIRRTNELGLVVTLKLPAGGSRLGFSVVKTEGAAQLTQSTEVVQANLAIQSNEIPFVVKVASVPPPVSQPAPSSPEPSPTSPAPSPEPPPPTSCSAGCHGPLGGPPPHGT